MSISLVTREKKIKIIMGYHLTPFTMSKIKRLTLSRAGEDVEQLELSHIVAGKSQPLWKTIWYVPTQILEQRDTLNIYLQKWKKKTRNHPNFHQKVNVKNKIIAYLTMEYSSAIEGVDEHTTGEISK